MSSLRNDAPLSAPLRSRLPRPAEDALRRARLRVVPQRLEEARRTPFVVLVVLLLAGGVAGLLTFNTSMQQASFRATALQEKASTLTARKQSLAMQLAADRDPQQLAARAKKLGMVPPPDPAFVRLSDGAVLGTPTAATPDDAMRINPLPASKPGVLAPAPKVVHVPAAADLPATGSDLPVAPTTSNGSGTVEKTPTLQQGQQRQKKGRGDQQ